MNQQSLWAVFLFSGLVTWAQRAPVNADKGIALGGYDAVSYFEGVPVKGVPAHAYMYKGTTYLFSRDENRTAFMGSPEKYLPRYGGWCAYAMGIDGSLVPVNQETYKIIDGRLYLFYNSGFNNTLKKWNRREETLLPGADAQWEIHMSSETRKQP